MVLQLSEGKASFCTALIFKKICGFLLKFSTGFTSFSVLFLIPSPSSICIVFDAISSNADKNLSINPSANDFVFGDFNVHHKDWLTYPGVTDRPGKLGCIIFLSQMILLTWSLTAVLTVLLFWIYFFFG